METKAVIVGWALYVALMLVYSLFYLICKIREPDRRALARDSGVTADHLPDHCLAQSMPPARREAEGPETRSASVPKPDNAMPGQSTIPLALLGSRPESPLRFRLPK